MLRGQSLWTALVFNPFQCHTPHTDDLAEGFAGFKSSLATDGKDMPSKWMCSAIPFLNSLQNICNVGSTFFFPFLFCWLWFLIYFDLSLHINLEVSLHNLLERCMLCFLVSAFLNLMVQPCEAVERCGGRQVGNQEGMERYHLFLHRIHAWHLPALSTAPAHAGWSISTLQISSEYPWVLLPAAKRAWETSACTCHESCSGGKSSQFMG